MTELYEIEFIYMLFVAIVKRARLDAKQGDQAAAAWLESFLEIGNGKNGTKN